MTTDDPGLDSEAILAMLETAHAHEEPRPGEGLRDRKKRHQRQRISNVATALFLAEGFDTVSVSRIAAACEVSEKTVFNYFPTKESMFLDRTGEMAGTMAAAVRHPGQALSADVARALAGGGPSYRWGSLDEGNALRLFRRFCDVAQSSPAIRTAIDAEFGSFTAVLGSALAERIGADPDAAEVRLTAVVILGLAHVRTLATFTHVREVSSFAALGRAVRGDLERALLLAAPMLDAFDGLRLRSASSLRRD